MDATIRGEADDCIWDFRQYHQRVSVYLYRGSYECVAERLCGHRIEYTDSHHLL